MTRHLIIIGGVAAGTKAAAKARREDHSLKITVYTADTHISYAGCGLPYYIGDQIKQKEQLLVKTPEDFKQLEDINVHINHKVTAINPERKEITILDLVNNKEFKDQYDDLVIATGAFPIIPPLEGIDSNNIFCLRNVNDAINIKEVVDRQIVHKAVIVGAGLIGMETAEALKERGLDVTVIELADQILGPIDTELASEVEKHCIEKGITIKTSEKVIKFEKDINGNVKKVITDKNQLDADLVILSIGIRPNITIAKEAGVEIGETGAIKVNSKMQTNIPNIYAAGDCAESIHLVTQKPVWVPLGSVANKQGRVVAENITGFESTFKGVLGSLIVKVFDYNVAKTGLSEKEAIRYGYNYEQVTIKGKDKAGYYPGNKEITIKLLVNEFNNCIIGCQIIGKGSVDKRIDTIAVAITSKKRLEELLDTDFAYSPPYSMAIELLLVAFSKLQEKVEKACGQKAESNKVL